jgi:amidase
MAIDSGPPLVIPRGPQSSIYAFSADNPCCAQVEPGSIVLFETLDCFGGQIKSEEDTFDKISWDRINPATGPLCVKTATKGDVLAVKILKISIESPGYMVTVPGMGTIPNRTGIKTVVVPIKHGLAHLPPNILVATKPMIGVIGVAPLKDSISTGTPGTHGGNLDTKVITEGSTVYLPVSVPGAKLAIGDLHALMGDGEVSICGVEVQGSVKVKVDVIKGMNIASPIVETDDAYYVIWSDETLDIAAIKAVDLATTLVSQTLKCSDDEAIGLLSAGGNLQICQIVDPLKTVRFEIPKVIVGKRSLVR